MNANKNFGSKKKNFRKKRLYIEHDGVYSECKLLLQKQYFARDLSQDSEKEERKI